MAIDRKGYYGHKVLKGTVDASGLATIRDRQPDIGEIIEYNNVTVENETSANSIFRIGVRTPFEFVLASFSAALAVDTPFTYDDSEIKVTDDKTLEIQVSAGTSGDTVVVYLHYAIRNTQQD